MTLRNQNGEGSEQVGDGVLEGRVCLVIGGGSIAAGLGIGRAIAVSYARAGAKVAVADLSLESAEETVSWISREGGCAAAFQVDSGDDVSVQSLVEAVQRQIGPVDVLHNNVGISKPGNPCETSSSDWRRIQDANVTSLHIATQAVVPEMIRRRKGVILTTSSVAGLRHLGYSSVAYAVTKAAAIHFNRIIAVEYAPHGIRANCIIAGLIDTPRIGVCLADAYGGIEAMRARRDAVVPLGRMGEAWDVAEAALFLASDKAKYITGAELIVDGGLSVRVPH